MLSGETLTPLRADASTATPANAPTSRVSDVSDLPRVGAGAVYVSFGRRKFWGVLSPISNTQIVEIVRELELLSYEFGTAPSYTSGSFIRSSRRKPGSRAACSGGRNPGSRLAPG